MENGEDRAVQGDATGHKGTPVQAGIRIGEGWDLHRLEPGRPLVVACTEIPFDKGPLGHSDGDVAAHALCDALLGALALGDIGKYFPPSDERWRGMNSSHFLQHVMGLLQERSATLINADVTVILEKPKLSPHIATMRENLARVLGCGVDRVSVKAKSAEGLGAVGEGRAVEARAVVLVSVG